MKLLSKRKAKSGDAAEPSGGSESGPRGRAAFDDRPSWVLAARQWATGALAIGLSIYVAGELREPLSVVLKASKLLPLFHATMSETDAAAFGLRRILALAVVLVLFDSARFHLRRHFLRYRLFPSEVVIDEGISVRRTHRVPLRQVTQVEVEQTPLGRLFDFGDLHLHTAGGVVTLRHLPEAHARADLLMSSLAASAPLSASSGD